VLPTGRRSCSGHLRGAYGRPADALTIEPGGEAICIAQVGGRLVRGVVMGFALWRSCRLPRWLAVPFTDGLEVAEAQSAKEAMVILFMLAWAIAMVLLAARTLDPVPRTRQQLKRAVNRKPSHP
jgi:hypothetical protein